MLVYNSLNDLGMGSHLFIYMLAHNTHHISESVNFGVGLSRFYKFLFRKIITNTVNAHFS